MHKKDASFARYDVVFSFRFIAPSSILETNSTGTTGLSGKVLSMFVPDAQLDASPSMAS